MFHAIEKYKLPVQIIVGLIAITFVGFGASTLAAPGHDFISKVGDFKISEADISDAMRRVQQAGGGQIDKNAVYQALLQENYLRQGAQDLGLEASEEQIKKVIMREPSFQENGKFSKDKYHVFLQQSGLKETDLVEDMRKQFAIQTMINLAQAGNMVSDVQARQITFLLQAPRQIRTVAFPLSQFSGKVAVDDARLQAFYQQNKSRYVLDQAVKFSYVVLQAKNLGAKEPVSAGELKAAYDAIPNSASSPKPSLDSMKGQLADEVRLHKGEQKLQKAKEQLADLAFNHPKDLKTVADKMGLVLQKQNQWLTRAQAQAIHMPDALQKALFSDDVLVKKYNSEPISMGEDAVWVVRADEVRAKHQASFAEVKAQLQQDYVAEESHKQAIAAATAAFQATRQGKTANIHWSALSSLAPQQAVSMMPKNDFKQWIKARPSNGKPAYVLLTGTAAPMLVEIQSIQPPANAVTQIPQAKMAMAQSLGQINMSGLLNWLAHTYKVKQGAQKLNTMDE